MIRLRKLALAGLLVLLIAPTTALQAQNRPSQRQLRTYIPPDQLVSFLPSTPFTTFIDYLNPIFERVTGKTIVDPTSADFPVGISIGGMHFFDALELVLDYHNLTYRETERYFMIEEAPANVPAVLGASEARAGGSPVSEGAAGPASLRSREIQINAVLFELNATRARELGIDWNVFFGEGGQSGTGGTSGGSSGSSQTEQPVFRVKTDQFFSSFDDIIESPSTIELSTLTRLFRLLENEGAGETVANPQITVQSAEKGRIQIGSDVPVQVRDFSGNTITQFYSTGIIVEVTPTLMTEAVSDTAMLDFIHLDVKVEKSASRPSLAGLVIDRNDATTQVLLLDGEQTIIGGLYSTEESVSRRGIPLLKDLPGWFFGLRYLFGVTQRATTQKELLIVLQAKVLDPLPMRAARPLELDMKTKRRDQVREALERAGFEDKVPKGEPDVR